MIGYIFFLLTLESVKAFRVPVWVCECDWLLVLMMDGLQVPLKQGLNTLL